MIKKRDNNSAIDQQRCANPFNLSNHIVTEDLCSVKSWIHNKKPTLKLANHICLACKCVLINENLFKLKNELQSQGLQKQDLRKSLLQLTSKPYVVLERDSVYRHYRREKSKKRLLAKKHLFHEEKKKNYETDNKRIKFKKKHKVKEKKFCSEYTNKCSNEDEISSDNEGRDRCITNDRCPQVNNAYEMNPVKFTLPVQIDKRRIRIDLWKSGLSRNSERSNDSIEFESNESRDESLKLLIDDDEVSVEDRELQEHLQTENTRTENKKEIRKKLNVLQKYRVLFNGLTVSEEEEEKKLKKNLLSSRRKANSVDSYDSGVNFDDNLIDESTSENALEVRECISETNTTSKNINTEQSKTVDCLKITLHKRKHKRYKVVKESQKTHEKKSKLESIADDDAHSEDNTSVHSLNECNFAISSSLLIPDLMSSSITSSNLNNDSKILVEEVGRIVIINLSDDEDRNNNQENEDIRQQKGHQDYNDNKIKQINRENEEIEKMAIILEKNLNREGIGRDVLKCLGNIQNEENIEQSKESGDLQKCPESKPKAEENEFEAMYEWLVKPVIKIKKESPVEESQGEQKIVENGLKQNNRQNEEARKRDESVEVRKKQKHKKSQESYEHLDRKSLNVPKNMSEVPNQSMSTINALNSDSTQVKKNLKIDKNHVNQKSNENLNKANLNAPEKNNDVLNPSMPTIDTLNSDSTQAKKNPRNDKNQVNQENNENLNKANLNAPEKINEVLNPSVPTVDTLNSDSSQVQKSPKNQKNQKKQGLHNAYNIVNICNENIEIDKTKIANPTKISSNIKKRNEPLAKDMAHCSYLHDGNKIYKVQTRGNTIRIEDINVFGNIRIIKTNINCNNKNDKNEPVLPAMQGKTNEIPSAKTVENPVEEQKPVQAPLKLRVLSSFELGSRWCPTPVPTSTSQETINVATPQVEILDASKSNTELSEPPITNSIPPARSSSPEIPPVPGSTFISAMDTEIRNFVEEIRFSILCLRRAANIFQCCTDPKSVTLKETTATIYQLLYEQIVRFAVKMKNHTMKEVINIVVKEFNLIDDSDPLTSLEIQKYLKIGSYVRNFSKNSTSLKKNISANHQTAREANTTTNTLTVPQHSTPTSNLTSVPNPQAASCSHDRVQNQPNLVNNKKDNVVKNTNSRNKILPIQANVQYTKASNNNQQNNHSYGVPSQSSGSLNPPVNQHTYNPQIPRTNFDKYTGDNITYSTVNITPVTSKPQVPNYHKPINYYEPVKNSYGTGSNPPVPQNVYNEQMLQTNCNNHSVNNALGIPSPVLKPTPANVQNTVNSHHQKTNNFYGNSSQLPSTFNAFNTQANYPKATNVQNLSINVASTNTIGSQEKSAAARHIYQNINATVRAPPPPHTNSGLPTVKKMDNVSSNLTLTALLAKPTNQVKYMPTNNFSPPNNYYRYPTPNPGSLNTSKAPKAYIRQMTQPNYGNYSSNNINYSVDNTTTNRFKPTSNSYINSPQNLNSAYSVQSYSTPGNVPQQVNSSQSYSSSGQVPQQVIPSKSYFSSGNVPQQVNSSQSHPSSGQAPKQVISSQSYYPSGNVPQQVNSLQSYLPFINVPQQSKSLQSHPSSGNVQQQIIPSQSYSSSGQVPQQVISSQSYLPFVNVPQQAKSLQSHPPSGNVQQQIIPSQSYLSFVNVPQQAKSLQAHPPSGNVQQQIIPSQSYSSSGQVPQQVISSQPYLPSVNVPQQVKSLQSHPPSGNVQQQTIPSQSYSSSGQVPQQVISSQSYLPSVNVPQQTNSSQSYLPSINVPLQANSSQSYYPSGNILQQTNSYYTATNNQPQMINSFNNQLQYSNSLNVTTGQNTYPTQIPINVQSYSAGNVLPTPQAIPSNMCCMPNNSLNCSVQNSSPLSTAVNQNTFYTQAPISNTSISVTTNQAVPLGNSTILQSKAANVLLLPIDSARILQQNSTSLNHLTIEINQAPQFSQAAINDASISSANTAASVPLVKPTNLQCQKTNTLSSRNEAINVLSETPTSSSNVTSQNTYSVPPSVNAEDPKNQSSAQKNVQNDLQQSSPAEVRVDKHYQTEQNMNNPTNNVIVSEVENGTINSIKPPTVIVQAPPAPTEKGIATESQKMEKDSSVPTVETVPDVVEKTDQLEISIVRECKITEHDNIRCLLNKLLKAANEIQPIVNINSSLSNSDENEVDVNESSGITTVLKKVLSVVTAIKPQIPAELRLPSERRKCTNSSESSNSFQSSQTQGVIVSEQQQSPLNKEKEINDLLKIKRPINASDQSKIVDIRNYPQRLIRRSKTTEECNLLEQSDENEIGTAQELMGLENNNPLYSTTKLQCNFSVDTTEISQVDIEEIEKHMTSHVNSDIHTAFQQTTQKDCKKEIQYTVKEEGNFEENNLNAFKVDAMEAYNVIKKSTKSTNWGKSKLNVVEESSLNHGETDLVTIDTEIINIQDTPKDQSSTNSNHVSNFLHDDFDASASFSIIEERDTSQTKECLSKDNGIKDSMVNYFETDKSKEANSSLEVTAAAARDAFTDLSDDIMEIDLDATISSLETDTTKSEANCLRCGRNSTLVCIICLTASYCSKRCQELHWKAYHHKHCNG
ncbi:protein PF3D7_1417600-like isoform X3 [Prorops nasuta]|uniref:protein PF3D7_1417600-like isoform X3 n=1 Tax=Prorops nasuta TaxID=863751 RepID=UPI0034CE48AE